MRYCPPCESARYPAPYDIYDMSDEDAAVLDTEGGLRPDLTGRGLTRPEQAGNPVTRPVQH
jgi:hypothetical protein